MPRTETNPALCWRRAETGREDLPVQAGLQAQRPRHASHTLQFSHAEVPGCPAAPVVPNSICSLCVSVTV